MGMKLKIPTQVSPKSLGDGALGFSDHFLPWNYYYYINLFLRLLSLISHTSARFHFALLSIKKLRTQNAVCKRFAQKLGVGTELSHYI